jgi:hypothetical protein
VIAPPARIAMLAALAGAGCASLPKAPAAEVGAAARAADTYSAAASVRLRGETVRARARALVAWQRPDRLRLEIPGPSGARFVAVTRDGRISAVFPGEAASFEGNATPEVLEELLGIRLAPADLMDALVGVAPPHVRRFEARWGPRLPRAVDLTLADGARLKLELEDAEIGIVLGAEAFAPPARAGYRSVDAAEARSLFSR